MADHANFQNEIYLQGMAGTTPELPMTYEGLDAAAPVTNARWTPTARPTATGTCATPSPGGLVSSSSATAEVVDAVGDVPVLFDSGVRSGADVFTAVCLGARAVLLGRPWVYGLGLAGEACETHVLRSIMAEFDLTMALAGQTSVAELDRRLLRHA